MDICDRLRAAGYEPRPAECLALRAVERAAGGVRALLLEGPPGCGKTALAEAYATATGARYVYALLHSWSDDQELFRGVDVCAAVAGDAARVSQPGVLAVAAEASQKGPVVLCLDELDKAPERVEALLLDVLQSGRVPVRPGEHVSMRLDNVVVFLTTNAMRPITDALLRRVRRVRMQPLPVETIDRIVRERTGAPKGVVTLASRLARETARAEGNASLSLQEIAAFVRDAFTIAESADDVRILLAQWACRESDAPARKADVAPLWGEIVRARRAADAPAATLADMR